MKAYLEFLKAFAPAHAMRLDSENFLQWPIHLDVFETSPLPHLWNAQVK